jgi:hypothetical protein
MTKEKHDAVRPVPPSGPILEYIPLLCYNSYLKPGKSEKQFISRKMKEWREGIVRRDRSRERESKW